MSDSPTPLSMERGGKGKTAIPEEKEDEPSLLPMTPESKQLAAVIATAVATAMAGKSASPDSSSSMVRYSAGVSLASRTRSIISIVRNLKLHLVTLPGAVVDVSFLTSSTDEDSRKALERRKAWAPRFVTAVPSRSKLWPRSRAPAYVEPDDQTHA